MPVRKRRKAPPIQRVHRLSFPDVEQHVLRNGISVYLLPHPSQQALKLEVVFRAGRPEEHKPLAARATGRLLREGTMRHNGAELAELFDFYGSSIQVPAHLDTSNVLMYSLKKYASDTVPLLAEIIRQPSFPQAELDLFKHNSIRELTVELEKGEVVAYRELTAMLFGPGHPYGYNSTPDLYNALERDDLTHHYNHWYTADRCTFFLSGGVDEYLITMIDDLFEDLKPLDHDTPAIPAVPDHSPEVRHFERKGVSQTAIKLGRRLFNRHHPDYNGMYVLNTVLGGFFGSRLSMNVRERLGFTYNIYSSIDAMLHDGFLYIATEVDNRKAEATLKEICWDLERLQQDPIADHELDMVRNYLLGMLLNGLDGPLNTADLLRGYVTDGLSVDSFQQLTETIRNITPEELQELAQRYLSPKDFSVVMVG